MSPILTHLATAPMLPSKVKHGYLAIAAVLLSTKLKVHPMVLMEPTLTALLQLSAIVLM